MRSNRLATTQFPGTGAVAERFAGECTDRADVDHVAGQLGIHRGADEGLDLGVLATVGHAEFHLAGDFLAETDAARALDAARHLFHGDQRADVLGHDHALLFFVAGAAGAIAHSQILQLALTALVADGAIQRVVDQQEFHHGLLRLDGLVALGVHHHALGHRRCASRNRLGHLLDIHQTHAAVGRNAQLLVVAKMRNIGTGLLSRMHQHAAFSNLDLLTVQFDFNHGDPLVKYMQAPCRSCALRGMQIRHGNA